MSMRGIARSATKIGEATPTNAPVYIDSDDNILKMIPAGSGSTEVQVVDASSTQTLTNKTISSPVGAIASETVIATNVITAAESGTTFFLSSATEFASTLPAPAAGLFYRFIVTAAPSGADYTVVTNAAAQILAGRVHDAGGAAGDVEATATGTTINFVSAASVVGDMAEVYSDGTSWFAICSAAVATGITITG